MQKQAGARVPLDQLHTLGGELSLDRARQHIGAKLETWWGTRPTRLRGGLPTLSAAIVGIYARLAATARGFGQELLPRHPLA